jgi:hypothetical protein
MPVTAQQVERDLAEFWKPLPGDREKDLGLQRVYTTNLVAYAEDPADGFRVERTLHHLAEIHPGRFILIRPGEAEEGEPPSGESGSAVRRFLSGHCVFFQGREKKVCCEMVLLEARRDTLVHLYGLAFSLLLPDLPVEFWWPGDLSSRHPFFRQMAEESTRVWVDSSRFKDGIQGFVGMAGDWGSRCPRAQLGDLNWVRLNRWRALIAELFDGEWSPYLSSIREVTVKYGNPSHPIRPFYLACWLAAQLGWRADGSRFKAIPERFQFMGPKGAVSVRLVPVPSRDEMKDRIYSVGLSTGGEKPGRFSVDRGEDPFTVVARSEAENRTAFSRTVTFEHLHTYELLGEGLRHQERDTAFEKTMRIAGSVLEKVMI